MKIQVLSYNDPIPDWVPKAHHSTIRHIIGSENIEGDGGNVVILELNGVFEYYWDNGEPEDNTFHRDYRWVPEALKRAFDAGRKAEREEIPDL